MDSLTSRVKQTARSLGFVKIGIAPVSKLEKEGLRLTEWLNRHYHGTMSWMERNLEKRVDPKLVLPDAKSIISVAMNYYTPYNHSSNPKIGKISRYAWGDDYHDILGERLERLLDFITSEVPDVRGRVYVDTGPVMEKVWAEKAGIGWIGKHTNVITQEVGSWVFLGELILDLDLEYDTPATDHCGSCDLCIQACPTDAITEPYILDSNKCISYLTIEHRGEIATELGEKFDRWIYGCDICQDVCPWNHKFSTATEIAGFSPREINQDPTLQSLSEMPAGEFSRNYKNSPVKRTKHSGLKRNVEAVLSSQSEK
jgi:epoxyqueuosine reductase